MKKLIYSKMLLLVAAWLVGVNAWADAGDITTNADIDFSNAITDGAVAGTVNSMTIGSGEIAKNGDTGWLSVYDATSTITIPVAQRAGSRDIVNIKFKMAWGNKNSMGSGFNLKDAENNALAEFRYARWDGSGTNSNTLNINMSGLVGGHNGNKPIAARYTLFDITINYATQTITSVVFCNNTDGKGTTKEETFETSLINKNPIATFNIFGYGVGGNTDRASIIDDITIKTTEGDYSVSTYDYTVNWVFDNEIIKTTTRQGEAGASIALTSVDKEPFTVADQKYYYVSDDAEGKSVASDNSTVVTVTMREAETWSYTVQAVNESSVVLGSIATGTVVEGESTSVNYSQYYLNNNVLLKADNSGTNSHWTKSFTPNADDYKYNITYKASGSVNNVVYFSEAEELENVNVLTANNANIRCSGAAAAYATADVTLTTLEAGLYTVAVQAFSPQSAGGSITINAGEDLVFVSGNANTTFHTSKTILVSDATDVVLKSGGGNRNGTDFIYIQKVGDYYESMSIVGNFSENAWDATLGIAMTRNAENPFEWTAIVKDYTITSTKYYYEYKAVANGNWDDYVLPEGDNQNYNFDYDGARDGIYTLTFTVNTQDHTVGMTPVKQPTATIYFINTNDWAAENIKAWIWDANNSDYNYTGGSWPGQTMTATGEQIDGKDVYSWSTYVLNPTPTHLIISNNGSDSERTGNQAFVNGKTYKADGSVLTVAKEITSARYATIYSSYALDFTGTGLTAYIAKADGDNVVFETVTTIPANTGVLLKGDKGDYNIAVVPSSSTNVSANIFEGVTEATEKEAGIFVLMNDIEGVGFYKTKSAFTVGANTAYIPGDVVAARTFIGFDEESGLPTAIGLMHNEKCIMHNEMFNLNGQRVAAPQRGLYIVGGKKVVVK